MVVVLDTNVLVQLFGARSPLIRLRTEILDGRIAVAVSTAILLEYEEVVCRLAGRERWSSLWRLLELTHQLHGNLVHVAPTYRWRVVVADPDDDHFEDCAIAARADWIFTEDAHFQALAGSGHHPQPIAPGAFIACFLGDAGSAAVGS